MVCIAVFPVATHIVPKNDATTQSASAGPRPSHARKAIAKGTARAEAIAGTRRCQRVSRGASRSTSQPEVRTPTKVGAAWQSASSDPAREAWQIERLERLAVEADLDPVFARKFLNFVIDEVIRHHKKHQK